MKPPYPTPLQLRNQGEAQRKTCPRTALAEWKPSLRKRAPLDLLRESVKGRLPKLIEVKLDRMAASPFGFFRGAVPVMAYDLSLLPNTGIVTQLCGDAHVQNLGAYEGLDGRLAFDINDFDETIRGPFDWDVRRMAVSILLAGSGAGIKPGASLQAVALFIESYRELLQRLAAMPVLEVARFQVHRLAAVAPISSIFLKAQRATPRITLDKLTERTGKARIFRTDPCLWPVKGREEKQVLDSLKPYIASLLPERRHFFAQFRPVAVGFKVVGTGSVGLRDYCVYMEGNSLPGQSQDPLFLQIKEEAPSAWLPYLPAAHPPVKHQGERVAEGQRAMQLQSDPLLGWTRMEGRDYLVRQLNDHKASVDMTKLNSAGLRAYAEVCGEMLARGHARSGDARVLSGYIGRGDRFAKAIAGFASGYAEQTVADWHTLVKNRKAN